MVPSTGCQRLALELWDKQTTLRGVVVYYGLWIMDYGSYRPPSMKQPTLTAMLSIYLSTFEYIIMLVTNQQVYNPNAVWTD